MIATIQMPRKYGRIEANDGWWRVKRVAQYLQVSERAVQRMCADGRLQHRREGPGARLIFIDPASVRRLAELNGAQLPQEKPQ